MKHLLSLCAMYCALSFPLGHDHVLAQGSIHGFDLYGTVKWQTKVYPKNPDYLEVDVDLTKLHTNMDVQEVVFTAKLYNKVGKLIGTKTYNIPAGSVGFSSGASYKTYVRSAAPGCYRAVGKLLTYRLLVNGGYPYGPLHFNNTRPYPKLVMPAGSVTLGPIPDAAEKSDPADKKVSK